MIEPLSDEKIVDSWHTNARAWTDAVRERRIATRNLVTNQAILDAILSRSPRTLLDLGCGEGWLVREMAKRGVRSTGVDAVPALIERAGSAGGGEFRVASFEEIARDGLDVSVDVAVANFSFIGRESVAGVISRAPAILAPAGALIIQTMHPVVECGEDAYEDGWRPGSWGGFSDDFSDPAPWYFRTLESWVRLLSVSGLRLAELREPIHPETQRPASVIFIAEAGR